MTVRISQVNGVLNNPVPHNKRNIVKEESFEIKERYTLNQVEV